MSDIPMCECPDGEPDSAEGCVMVRSSMVWACLIGDVQAIKTLAAMVSGPCPLTASTELEAQA